MKHAGQRFICHAEGICRFFSMTEASCCLVTQAALRPGQGWATLDEVFRQLPGPRFEVHQTMDEQGMPKEAAAQLSKSSPGMRAWLLIPRGQEPTWL